MKTTNEINTMRFAIIFAPVILFDFLGQSVSAKDGTLPKQIDSLGSPVEAKLLAVFLETQDSLIGRDKENLIRILEGQAKLRVFYRPEGAFINFRAFDPEHETSGPHLVPRAVWSIEGYLDEAGVCTSSEVSVEWEIGKKLGEASNVIRGLGSELLRALISSKVVGERLTTSNYDRIRSVKLNLLRFPNGKSKAEAIEITIACERDSETKLPDGRLGTESTTFTWIVGVSRTNVSSIRYFKILSDVSPLTDTDGIAAIQPYLPSN